jgi:hypothetical protein
MPNTKVAQRQFWHEISGVSGTWASSSGAGLTTAATKARDGGAPNTDTLTGQPEYADLSLTRPYDAARDVAVEAQLDLLVRRAQEVTVTRVMADPNGFVSAQRTWTGRIVGVTPPDTDSMSGAPATITVTISVDRAA